MYENEAELASQAAGTLKSLVALVTNFAMLKLQVMFSIFPVFCCILFVLRFGNFIEFATASKSTSDCLKALPYAS